MLRRTDTVPSLFWPLFLPWPAVDRRAMSVGQSKRLDLTDPLICARHALALDAR